MQSIRACIFDLDGVIVDTAKYHFLAWQRLAQELGFEFTAQQNERLKGVSRMRSLDILLEIGGVFADDQTKIAMAARKNEWYIEYISRMDESEILPGAKALLTELRHAAIKTALGSASQNAQLIIQRIGMANYFDVIVDGTRVTKAKPDPEVFLLCAAELGVAPDDCIVFEDAKAGIEAALRAGMRCVGVGSPKILGQANLVVKSLQVVTLVTLGAVTMQNYFKQAEWLIIEEGFHPEYQEISESIFSIGNGHMGQRANFEEDYSGSTLQGSYLAGVYYPDKTQVGWWKNGYPDYFAKVINSTNWIGIHVALNGETLDLATCEVRDFTRTLNMQEGYLARSFIATLASGLAIKVESLRFVSMTRPEIGAIRYTVTPLNQQAQVTITPYLDGDVTNRDANHGEQFWDEVSKRNDIGKASLVMKTKKLDFHVASTMTYHITYANKVVSSDPILVERDHYVAQSVMIEALINQPVTIDKYVANVTSRDYAIADLISVASDLVDAAKRSGFTTLLAEQRQRWHELWNDSDIAIVGDVAAQQGIRFAIFQLHQTYTGDDDRLNIGPKGFTGEKYGGGTYWDTEAYCLPFYLSTAPQKIARNLLLYRYRHLEQAKDNARKLGFTQGALFPMVTMNGEECHNEWEITFEEIHRNGAIAYAIYNYVNYTGDHAYLGEFGLEVLVEISRFWAARVNYSADKDKYVILGVTGPNEYENNVNNNWYTNRMASWTIEYTLDVMQYMQAKEPERLTTLHAKLAIDDAEPPRWRTIIANMYYPEDQKLQLFLQQDGFLDKEIIPVRKLPPDQLPLNQHWSWDRILRSCYIKQADVLQGMFFLGDHYDLETKRRHFDFYEPLTVHESSLSPCVHSVLACELGYREKAYELYLRTSRLDLDNYNNDTDDGCHITSMAGTWMAVVYGFGGFRVQDGKVHLNPFLLDHWQSFAFKILFRGARINVLVKKEEVSISNATAIEVPLIIYHQAYQLKAHDTLTIRSSDTWT